MTSPSDFLQAWLLGLVQGFSEFLPISSSGHLVLLQKLMPTENFNLFFILVLHLGSLLAIISYYKKELLELTQNFISNPTCLSSSPSSSPSPRVIYLIICASLPSVVAGVFLRPFVEKSLLDISWTGGGFILTAVLLALSLIPLKKNKKNLNQTWNSFGFLQAFLIGLAQVVAFFPGISRSGWTIACALFLGRSQKQAVFFSFLMAIPAILGGALLELFTKSSSLEQLTSASLISLIIGFFSSWFFGWIALKWLVCSLKNLSFPFFALYLGPLGIVIILFLK